MSLKFEPRISKYLSQYIDSFLTLYVTDRLWNCKTYFWHKNKSKSLKSFRLFVKYFILIFGGFVKNKIIWFSQLFNEEIFSVKKFWNLKFCSAILKKFLMISTQIHVWCQFSHNMIIKLDTWDTDYKNNVLLKKCNGYISREL